MLIGPLTVGQWVRAFDVPLPHAMARIRILQVGAGLLVVLPGVLSIWLHALHFTRRDYVTVAVTDDRVGVSQMMESVRSFLRDRAALLRAGSVLGATVGLATLAAGALRNALVVAKRPAISATLVLAYGAGYTAMLALVYMPDYLYMQSAGRRILGSFLPMELPDSPRYDEYLKRQSAWEELLQLMIGPADSLKIGTAVLAPIVTGVINVLVGVTL
jgi:hypothetical protein